MQKIPVSAYWFCSHCLIKSVFSQIKYTFFSFQERKKGEEKKKQSKEEKDNHDMTHYGHYKQLWWKKREQNDNS